MPPKKKQRTSHLAALEKEFRDHVMSEAKWQDGVTAKLDAILNTRINGFDPLPGELPLQTTLRGLYEIQRDKRVSAEFWRTFKAWREQKMIFQILKSKLGRWVFVGFLFLLANSLLHPYGISFSIQSILKMLNLIS